MAARFWQRVLLAEIGLAGIAAWLLAVVLRLSLVAALASGLAFLLALQWLLPAAARVLAHVRQGRARALDSSLPPRSHSLRAALRSLVTEGAALARAVLAMSVFPTHPPGRLASPTGASRPRPVLLIHGVLCNGAVWRPLVRRLAEVGFGPVRTLNLEPLGADIEQHAVRVARELIDLQRECGGERVTLVAHSMGGLVARAALRLIAIEHSADTVPGTPALRHIVTIATPHHGTAVAGLLRSKPMQQMAPDSPWLRALNASPLSARMSPGATDARPGATTGPAAVPLTSIYSLDDELVAPPSSARLEGARNVELKGIGHLGVLTSRQVSDAIIEALAGPSIEAARSCKNAVDPRSGP